MEQRKAFSFFFSLETFTVPHKTLAPSDSHKTRSEPDNLQPTLWPRSFLLENRVLHLADNNNADGSVFNNKRCARTYKYPLFLRRDITVVVMWRPFHSHSEMRTNEMPPLNGRNVQTHDNSEALLKQPESCKICRRIQSVRISVRFSKLHSPLLTTDPSMAPKKKPVRMSTTT